MKNEIIVNNDFDVVKANLLNQYLDYIDVSEKTQKTYKDGIKSFYSYIESENIKQPCRDDILKFRNFLKENKSISTTNTYMIAIRNFFKWLEYENIYKNITENIKGVKISNNHRKQPLTLEQVDLVLNNAKDNREKMIFKIAISLGLRANEIVNIRLEDFKLINGKVCLYILGKGRDGKIDYVPINDYLYKQISEYIKEYRIKDYLFTSLRKDDGSKVTTKTIRYIVKNMFKRVGICDDDYSLHSLRHSFATFNITNGVDIREVSKALRHKNLQTTEIYLHDLDMQNNKCFDINNIFRGEMVDE